MDAFARREFHRQAERAHLYALRAVALQVHLDPRFRLVPQRTVREGLRLELCVEFAVQPH
jgi:hypothetical protein